MLLFISGIIIGCLLTALTPLLWAFYKGSADKEFFDSQDLILNFQRNSSWGNLGYWQNSATYEDAATALAMKLGNLCQLDHAAKILDVGFGHGDQLALWRSKYSVQKIVGYNISQSQSQYAQEHFAEDTTLVHCLDAMAVERSEVVDRVLALDCAYHFASRENFFHNSWAMLGPGGLLGLVDLSFDCTGQAFHRRALLRIICWASNVPRENQWSSSSYQSKLEGCGFDILHWEDLSPYVFEGFADFVEAHGNLLRPWLKPRSFVKYWLTAWFLKKLYRWGMIQIFAVVGKRQTVKA